MPLVKRNPSIPIRIALETLVMPAHRQGAPEGPERKDSRKAWEREARDGLLREVDLLGLGRVDPGWLART